MYQISINRLKEKNSNLIIKYEMAEKEEWREIEGYENYEVSNFGNVRSFISNKILKEQTDWNGYKFVRLCKEGEKMRNKKIHKLVAEAFCENLDNYKVVDHKDRDKSNNHYTNLRFCTYSQNGINKSKQSNNTSGIVGVSFHKGKNKWRAQIKFIDKNLHIGYFKTFNEAAEARKKKEAELFGEFAPK